MTYFVGIDWADARHDICIMNPEGRVVNEFAIAHSLSGFAEFHAVLTTLGEVEINIERPNGLLVDYLVARGWSLHVTSPFLVAHRRAHTSKNDRGDALSLAQLLRSGDRDCRRLAVSSPLTEMLLHLVQQFDLLQRDRHRLDNRLSYWLKQYYPAALNLFRQTYQPLTLAFLERFPDPQTARAATLEEYEAFFKSQRYRYRERIPLIYQILQAPAPCARETAGYVGGLKALLAVLTTLNVQLKALEKQIKDVFQQHPEAAWWLRFPGCGPLTAARLLARIGDNRARFPTAGILQAVAGTVPITRRSGKQVKVYFRRECSHTLRRAVTDLARHSLKHAPWAQAYFTRQRMQGHLEQRACRALANRWVQIIWTLWQRREDYDEAKRQSHVKMRTTAVMEGAAAAD